MIYEYMEQYKNLIDARGLACPQPVILTKKALKNGENFTAAVDNETARKNIEMVLKKADTDYTVDEKQDGIFISVNALQYEQPAQTPHRTPAESAETGYIVVVPRETMGSGDDELGGVLIRGFFHALTEQEEKPAAVIFYNGGVKLAVEGSPVVEDLTALQSVGTEIVSCGTCLNHFELTDRLAVGEVSNMYTIIEYLISDMRTVKP